MNDPEWFGFDSLITSFALHHFDDPIHSLELLKACVKPGGTVVIVDWMKGEEDNKDGATAAQGVPEHTSTDTGTNTHGKIKRKYNPDDLMPVRMGKVWPGFSLQDIREDYEAAGLTDVDVRIWPEKIELPQLALFVGRVIMYISKASVPFS